jgi:hypothetical protein
MISPMRVLLFLPVAFLLDSPHLEGDNKLVEADRLN